MIRNKTIVITGGTSGIGKALCEKLEKNNKVYTIGRRRIERDNHIQLDITDFETLKDVLDNIVKKDGIDILILNAGVGMDLNSDEVNGDKIKKGFDVNFLSQVYALEAVLPYMKNKGEGIIVSVSSIADCRGLPTSPAYSASKAALTTFMEGMELNLSNYGISVVIVRPGFVDTPLIKNGKHKPFVISSQKCADIIIRGIEKRKKRVEFPLPMVLLTNFAHCLPLWAYRSIIKIWYKFFRKEVL